MLEFAGILSRTLGRWDPPNPVVIYDLGVLYYRAGRYAEAEAMYRKVLDLAPEFSWARYSLGKTLLAQDKPDVALIVVEQDTDEEVRLQMLAIVLQASGRRAEADEALTKLIAQWPTGVRTTWRKPTRIAAIMTLRFNGSSERTHKRTLP